MGLGRTGGTWKLGPKYPVNGVDMPTIQNHCGVGIAYFATLEDAQLAIAAPELLAAVQACLAVVKDVEGFMLDAKDTTIRDAELVIAKALGKGVDNV